MAENWAKNQTNCSIEFRVNDKQRFEIFKRFVVPLKAWTQHNTPHQAQAAPSDVTQEHVAITAKDDTQTHGSFGKPIEWLRALPADDLAYLNLPSLTEADNALESWEGLSRRERRSAIKSQENSKQLRVLADFVDMIRHWQDVEFELVTCEQPESDHARLTYLAGDYPVKGKTALEETLMFFGFFSIVHDSC